MSSRYDAMATRSLAAIKKHGAVVTFPGTFVEGTEPAYDPSTDQWTPGTAGSTGVDVTGRAVQIDGDPDRFAALNLVLVDPVTLMVAAKDLGITPIAGMAFVWPEDGTRYVIRDAQSVAPDGVPILWIIVGSS